MQTNTDYKTVLEAENYSIIILHGIQGMNPDNDNVDVDLVFDSGERYTATFFTLQNIQSLLDNYKITGECNSGQYFWASDMIIVEKLTPETIRQTVQDLLSTDFKCAFSGPHSPL